MNISYSRFATDKEPHCVWGWDLPQQNLDFLESLDPQFFANMAETHGTALNEDRGRKHAALALRLFYSHAIETLLALLSAAVQAPDCVVGWICLYHQEHLHAILESLSIGRSLLTKLDLTEPTWEGLSTVIHSLIVLDDKEKEAAIKRGYASFWAHAAQAYLNELNRLEYNSIKHGLRARSGGYTLRMRREKTPGVPDPDAPIHTIAASEFGSSFFVPERIGDSKQHVTLRHQAVNWRPQGLVDSLILISMSISNVVGYLRYVNGVEPSTIQFSWPSELDLFVSALRGLPGHQASSFGLKAEGEHITLLSKDQILEVYNR
jgi:hypothetical protein